MSDECLFCRIAAGEVPANVVRREKGMVAFHDIAPKAPVHVLVIPRGPYVCYDHFVLEASDAEIVDFNRAVGEVVKAEGLQSGGYRIISNAGEAGVQEVPQLHVHVLGGRGLGRMLQPAR